MKPVIDQRKCLAQEKYCTTIPACPEKAITYVVDEKAKLGGRIIIDDDLCIGCGDCVEVCCGSAIELI